MIVSPTAFAEIARSVLRMPTGRNKYSSKREHREFRAAFGVSFRLLSHLWSRLAPLEKISARAEPKHLLWTFLYLKVHIDESNMIKIVGCPSRDTFRFWVWRFVKAIAWLKKKVIVWNKWFEGWDGRTQCLTVIDGTDVKINEPRPCSSIWWSHKQNSAGLKYEVAQCIATGDIVSFQGPFPCNVEDRQIFDLFLSAMMLPGELTEADSGYPGRMQIMPPGVDALV